jgi:hypothetical protein
MKEIWRPIKDFPGYEISNTGRARSIDRYDSKGRFWKGRELKIRVPKYQPVENVLLRGVRVRRYGRTYDLDFDRLLYLHFTKDELDLPPQDAPERP